MTSPLSRFTRIGAGAADQYVYSLQNFLPAIAVARQVSVNSFAFFSSVMLVYSLLLGAGRACIGETLAVRVQTKAEIEDVLRTLRHFVWRVLVAEVLPVGALLAICIYDSRAAGQWLWVALIVLALPFHLAQDAGRVLLLSNRRTTVVLLADLLWLGLSALGLVAAARYQPLNAVTLLWACGGVVATFIVIPPLVRRPVNPAAIWERRYSLPSLTEYAMQPAVVQGSQLAAGLVGASSAVAALRGGAALFRPLQLALSAHRTMVIGGGRGARSSNTVLRTGLVFSVAGSLAFGALLWFTPYKVGGVLLGATWPLVHSIVVAFTLSQVASQMTYAIVTHLKAGRRLAKLGIVRLVGVFSIPVGTVGGALLAGAQGAAWGFCIGQWVGALWTFSRARLVTEL